jgi:hypothetical protein
MIRLFGVVLIMSIAWGLHAQTSFQYPAERAKFGRNETGTLEIDPDGISFKSANGQTSISIPLIDVKEMDLSDSSILRFETYDILKQRLGARRVHTFHLLEGKHDAPLRQFLASHLKRPIKASFDESTLSIGIPVYHRHRLSGCAGTLMIDSSGIRFLGQKSQDSRTWSYKDIETIGRMNPFHFRVSTFAETYNFDLKERLPDDLYNLAFSQLHGLPTFGNLAGK